MFRPLFLAFALSVSAAQAATPDVDVETPQGLSDTQMAELVDFVVGNAVFALYHQAGHMMIDRLGMDRIGGEQAADDFAAMTLLEPRTGAGDQTLVDAVDSWMLSKHLTASAQPASTGLPDRHSLDADRANAIVCNMVGANPTDFADIAEAASLTPELRANCTTTYQTKRAVWTSALKPLRRAPGAPLTTIPVFYDPPTADQIGELTVLHDNKVLEEVAARLANDFTLTNPPTLRAKTCGAETSSFDPATNEIVLCYELSSYHAELIVRDFQSR